MYVFLPPPIPDCRRPKAVEPWIVKLCREMLWSERFLWVTAQHGILEGWFAPLQPCIKKLWAQPNNCSRRCQKRHWGVTQSVGDVSKDTALGYCLIQCCLFTIIYKNTWFHCTFFLLTGLVEVHSLYSAARLISCRDAFLHMFQHIAGIYWHLCKERSDALRKWSSWPLCSAVEWSE